jgi:autotransporter-associated beta strand protein
LTLAATTNIYFAPLWTSNNLTVNLSGLTSFTYTNPGATFSVRSGLIAAGTAGTNTVTLAAGTNTIIAGNLGVGDMNDSGGISTSTLNLGTVNFFNANNINIGSSGSRPSGTIQFAGGLINPTLTIAGTAGMGTFATLTLGSHDSFQASDAPVDLLDTTAGTLNAQLGSVTIGQSTPSANSNGRGITITSSFKMGAGMLTVANMTVGNIRSQSNVTNDTIKVTALFGITNGGTAIITNLTLANNSLPPSGGAANTLTLSGTVSLTNGATLEAVVITNGASASAATKTNQIVWGDGTVGNIPGGNLSIGGVNVILAGASTTHDFNISSGQNGVISSVIGGPGALISSGGGTLIFFATNTYTGVTTISNGSLLVNGSIGTNVVNVTATGILGGVGIINGSVNLSGIIAPGNGGVGTLNTGAEVWNNGGAYQFGLNNATNSVGWDLLNISGTLNLSAASNLFTIKLVSLTSSNTPGPMDGFVDGGTNTWTLATASGGIANFNPAIFSVDTTAFANAYTGNFSVTTNGNSLLLLYTTAPNTPVAPILGGSVSYVGGSFSMSFSGIPGQNYRVLMTMDLTEPLTNWQVLTSGAFVDTNPVIYSDSAAIDVQRFYRIASP